MACRVGVSAWAELFKECLLANNISGSAIAMANAQAPDEGFGVKNFDFVDPPTWDYPQYDPWIYDTSDLDTSVAGIPGQNMATPQGKLFNYHRVVKVGSTYYDPSYGVTTDDPDTYTATYVEGWFREFDHSGIPIAHWRPAQPVSDDPLVFTP